MVGPGEIVYFRTWTTEFGVYRKGNRQPLKDFSRDSGLHFRRISEATVREHVGGGEALRREASLETTVPVQAEGVRA